jgi:hypothetical protein
MLRESCRAYSEHIHRWNEIKQEIAWEVFINFLFVLVVILLAYLAHNHFRAVDTSAVGILLVGLGAIRLALISARIHVREFYELSLSVEAVEERQDKYRRSRTAKNMIDAIIGFGLVALGFTIRVGVDFL